MGGSALGWISIAAFLALYLTLGLWSQWYALGFGVCFTEVFVILGAAWVLLRSSGRDPWRYARFSRVQPGAMWLGFLLGVANYFALVIPLQFAASEVLPKRWQQDVSKIFERQSRLDLVLITIGVVIAAPICEEFLFRGVFQQSLLARHRPWKAILIAAAIFSAFHFDAIGFFARLELGCLFGLLFLRYDSLWPGICAHAANNLIPTLILLQSPGGGGDQEPSARQVFLLGVVGLAVLLAIASLARVLPGSRPPQNPTPEDSHLPPQSVFAAARRWLVAALISIAAVVAWKTLTRS